MKSKKKGFTLVELLVVIAIIAILATVSVVGYVSFTSKAKESNDKVLIKQANTLLQGEEIINTKIETMHDVVKYVKSQGILVENLQTEDKGNYVVWNEDTNRFYILNSDNQVVFPEVNNVTFNKLSTWKIVDKYDENCQFSQYLKDLDYTETVINNVDTGLDVGFNDEFTNIKYTNLSNTGQTVNLRTNGGELIIDAPNDTVNHYGSSNICDVQNVDPKNSYHKFADVGVLKVKNGHIVLEKEFKEKPVITITSTTTDKISIDTKIDANVTVQEGAVATNVTIQTKETAKVSVSTDLMDKVQGNKEEFVITKVDTFESLSAALKDPNAAYIQLTNNIIATTLTGPDVLTISRSLTLDGNGFEIKSTENVIKGSRILNVCNLNSDNVTIKNLKLNMLAAKGDDIKGMSIYNNTNSIISFNFSDVSTVDYYAIFIGTGNKDITIDIDNGSVSAGWAAIYNKSSGVKLNAKNSSFIGINKYSNHPSNSFSTIVAAEYYKLNAEIGISNDNLFVFENCTIEAKLIKQNDVVQQHIIDVRSPMNNKVYLNNCNLISNSGNNMVCLYSNFDGDRSDKAFDGSSQIIINGKVDKDCYYIDGAEDTTTK